MPFNLMRSFKISGRLMLFALTSMLTLLALLGYTHWSAATVTARSYVAPSATAATCNDTWATMTTAGAPAGRFWHVAVWTGTEMIVWGGQGSGTHPDFPNTGGRYNPATNMWTPTSTIGAPASGRRYLTAVWTGTEMIVWGGQDSSFIDTNTGGRYNPATDTWTPTSTLNAPLGRQLHSAIWTGTEMIVYGGQSFQGGGRSNTGGRYNPATDTWIPTSTVGAPSRLVHTALWTGTEMIVWGGYDISTGHTNTGGRYNPATDSWTATSTTNAPVGREQHSAVWTGNEMIVWAGLTPPSGRTHTGGRYHPATDSWIATNTTSAPTARQQHSAVWTGSEMFVWGGVDNSIATLNTGSRYDPATDSWTATSTIGAPAPRSFHTAVWTNSEMIVWGGQTGYFNTGGRYCQGPPNNTPVARCQNVTVPAGPGNTAAASINNGSSDPDGDPLTFTQSPPGPYPVGTTSVTLTVTDGRGGSSMCSATVTVTPFNNPPVARCQNVNVSAGPSNTAPASINNGSSDPDGDPLTLTQSPPGPYPVGMNSVTLTVTDGRGGSSMCSATVTVTAFGQPPGDLPPAGAPPTQGSVLIYNYYASDALNPALENTTITMTNNHATVTPFVHLFFIDGNSCAVADSFVCLSPGQTITFLVSDVDPGVRGYIAAFSTDGNGVPNNFNFLSGNAAVKLASGHEAEFDAVAIPAIAAVPATVESLPCCGDVATVRFDGVRYARVPRVLELDPVYSQGDDAETLLAVNSLKGSLLFGVTPIGAFQGVLTNHKTGAPFNFTGSAGCRMSQILSDAFPLTSPVFSTALPKNDEGNLKIWANADQGICGVVFNRNPKKKGKKFNGGDNLRAVTVTSSSMVVPIFPPAC